MSRANLPFSTLFAHADLVVGLRTALGWKRFAAGLRDRVLWLVVFAGCIGLLYPPSATVPAVWRLVLSAFSEELTFRALIQEQLETTLPSGSPLLRRIGIVPANLLVSVLFALAHLPAQSVLAALSTFFPSLMFGLIWTRSRSLWLCTFLHIYYNILYQL
ncbi:MAG: JDVT-CTERM system glutamic-type intramembrane protease [Bilophila sp.]